MKYHSQYNQDRTLNELINQRRGFFIDIGAYDGINFSNSYFFETELDWNGICIEPLPNIFKNLQNNRKCILENCAISDIEETLDFVSIEGLGASGEMLSGFNRQGHAKSLGRPHEIIKVDCFRLDRILDKHNIKYADFCSIDTEGTELNVIKSINWDNYLIEYICVEKNNNEQKIMDYLKPYGYVRVNTILPLSGDMLLKKI